MTEMDEVMECKKVMSNWDKDLMMNKILELTTTIQAYYDKNKKTREAIYKCEIAFQKLANEHNHNIDWDEVYKQN